MAIGLMCVSLIERYGSQSARFCRTFQQEASSHGVRVLFNLINNRKVQEKFFATMRRHRSGQEFILMRGMLRTAALALARLARFSLAYRKHWHDANAVKNLLFYFKLDVIEIDLKVELALAIGFIADENDIDSNGLPDEGVMALLARMVGVASKKIKSGNELNRLKGLTSQNWYIFIEIW